MAFDVLHGLVPLAFKFAANAECVDSFLISVKGDWELVGASVVQDVAGSDGGAVTLDVVKCASGTTIASGTSLLASTFDMKSTADTPVHKTIANGGIATAEATRIITDGQSIAANFAGTVTALAGVALTLWLKPLRRPVFG